MRGRKWKKYNLGTLLKMPIEEFKSNKKKVYCKPEKQKNIDIVLNKIKIKPIDISDALLLYNEEILKEDNCHLLISIIPTDEEYNEISRKTEILENEEDFDVCDLFIVLIGCIRNNRERLEGILFKNSYSKKSVEILSFCDYFFKGFDFVKDNKHFHKFLEIILTQQI